MSERESAEYASVKDIASAIIGDEALLDGLGVDQAWWAEEDGSRVNLRWKNGHTVTLTITQNDRSADG